MTFRSDPRRQKEFDAGVLPDFLPETKHIRDDPSWRVRRTSTHTIEKHDFSLVSPHLKQAVVAVILPVCREGGYEGCFEAMSFVLC